MNNTTYADLLRIEADLREAEQDVALLTRLKGAEERVKALSSELAKARTAHEKAAAAKAKVAEDARFEGLSDIGVTDNSPDEGVLRSSFTINYTRIAYDMEAQRNVSSKACVGGFGGLPDNVLAYLIERHPSRIPAKVMNLAPGNPIEAFDRYFRGLSRGFVAA